MRWYKGNTHTHTNNSDGDSSPETAARWYKEHGYSFLVISDHNRLTDTSALDGIQTEEFIVIPGVELSGGFPGRPIDVNALNVHTLVLPQPAETAEEVLQSNVNAIRKAGGVPQLNHPNWHYAYGAAEMMDVRGWSLLEICNRSSDCNDDGDPGAGHPSTETIWDQLLSEGRVVYGVAVDDTHIYKNASPDRDDCPGRGWVVVRAEALTPECVMTALEHGQFYASTGVELASLSTGDSEYALEVAATAGLTYRTEFIAKDGEVLSAQEGPRASFRPQGVRGYVRARVDASDGSHCWTQPVFRL